MKRTTLMKKAQEKGKEKEKYRYRRITIPYVNGFHRKITREVKEFEILVSFKPYKKHLDNI